MALAQLSRLGAAGVLRAGSGFALDHPRYLRGDCVPQPHREPSPRPPPPVGGRALASASPTRGLAPLRKQAEATLPATAAVPSPARGVGHRAPVWPPLLPESYLLLPALCPQTGATEEKPGAPGDPSWLPTVASMHVGASAHWPRVGGYLLGSLLAPRQMPPSSSAGDSLWGPSGERLPQLQRWPTRWVSPLGGASPESQPQEALGTSYSYAVPQAAEVRQGRPGAGGLAGISLVCPLCCWCQALPSLASAQWHKGDWPAAPHPCPTPSPLLPAETLSPPSRGSGDPWGKRRLGWAGWRGCIPGTRQGGGASGVCRPRWAVQAAKPGVSLRLGCGLTSARSCRPRASCCTSSSSHAALDSSSLSWLVSASLRDRAWATGAGCS